MKDADPQRHLLNGLTRQRVIALLRADGVEVQETTVTYADFQHADEIFISGNYSNDARAEDRRQDAAARPFYTRAREALLGLRARFGRSFDVRQGGIPRGAARGSGEGDPRHSLRDAGALRRRGCAAGVHVPFMLKSEGEGALELHVARANPIWKLLAEPRPALAIFQGPQAYVRPGWYPAKAGTARSCRPGATCRSSARPGLADWAWRRCSSMSARCPT